MKLLFLCHGHPALQTGGTELFARDLFRALVDRPGMEGLFIGGVSALHRGAAPGTALQAAGTADDEMLLWTGGFDRFLLSQTDLFGVAPELEGVLRALRPDVVHLHHLLLLGVETVQLIRRILPETRIVLTLHDYHLLCAAEGQLLTPEGRTCQGPSVDRCRRCLPERSATDFRLRELHLRAMLGLVDRFIAPSEFLAGVMRRHFAAIGLDPERIAHVPNGIPGRVAPPSSGRRARRDRFGFFGHINRAKGAMLALDASARLSVEGVPHTLDLHGGTDWQTEPFLAGFRAALGAAPAARFHGGYDRAALPGLQADLDWIIVPSIWFENAPLVVQEARAAGLPVIAADHGGLAETVRDGIDGLLFRPGDGASLTACLRRAAETPGLWTKLARGVAAPPGIDESAAAHLALYRTLGVDLPEGQAPPLRARRAPARAGRIA